AWRCEVPITEVETDRSASICSDRMREGPEPKRPSAGSRCWGMDRARRASVRAVLAAVIRGLLMVDGPRAPIGRVPAPIVPAAGGSAEHRPWMLGGRGRIGA